MDGIVPYRMEHCVTLESTNDKPVNQYWKDKLTDLLIKSVKADDGILIHLSTSISSTGNESAKRSVSSIPFSMSASPTED